MLEVAINVAEFAAAVGSAFAAVAVAVLLILPFFVSVTAVTILPFLALLLLLPV